MLHRNVIFAAVCLVAACGGGGGGGGGTSNPPPQLSQFPIGGSVSGLNGSVVLQLNGGETLTVTRDGAFTFTEQLASGTSYQVAVTTQPAGQQCSLVSGSGTANGNVSTIQVNCSNVAPPTRLVGGSVSGLSPATLTLRLNQANDLFLSSDGAFSFPTPLSQGAPYQVTIPYPPGDRWCELASASGIVGSSNPNVIVTCVPTYFVRFRYSGVRGELVVQNNGTDEQTISTTGIASGITSFPARVLSGATYDIRIRTQPAGQQCTVTGGSGTVTNSDAFSASIVCETIVPTFTVGGAVTGLNGTLRLRNNASDELTLSSSGPFAFATPLQQGSQYQVTIASQPPAQRCAMTGGGGAVENSNITSVAISCTNLTPHTLGGRLIGVTSPIVLTNNYTNALTLASDGAFTFTTALVLGSDFAVAASSADPNQMCHVAGGTGTMPDEPVANIRVVCSTKRSTRFVYVVNQGDQVYSTGRSISQYSVGVDGGLSPLSPASVPVGGARPLAITAHPSGRFLYVRSADAETGGATSFWQYSIDSSGALTPMATPSVSGGNAPGDLVFDPSGAYAYATRGSDVLRFAIEADGSLATPQVQNLTDTSYALRSIAFDRAGEHAYISGASSAAYGVIHQFSIASDGSFTAMSPANVDAGLPFVVAILAEPFDRFVYSVDGGFSRIAQFRREEDGTLIALHPAAYNATMAPFQIRTDPFGRFAYTVASVSVSTFVIASTGVLVDGTPERVLARAGETFSSVALDLAGEHLYVTSSDATGGWVHQYQIGSDGALTRIDAASVASGLRPVAIAVVP